MKSSRQALNLPFYLLILGEYDGQSPPNWGDVGGKCRVLKPLQIASKRLYCLCIGVFSSSQSILQTISRSGLRKFRLGIQTRSINLRIWLQNISKAYKQRSIVDRVSLTINLGEIVGLLGPNGAG